MKRFVIPLAVAACLLAVVAQNTPVAAKDTWVSLRTKNFSMLGNASEKDIRRVAVKLEQFREVFTNLFPNTRFNTPVPTTVVVFKSDSSYGPFKPKPDVAGYFQPGPDVNYITLTTEVRGEQDPFSVIFHEYIHLLIENTFPNVPVWFNEGLAEYYSTFTISDDQKVVLGSPISNHVYLLRESRMLPLRTLFEVDHKSAHYNETDKRGIFYAQSWALMHYFIIGKEGRSEKLREFIGLLNSKVPMEEAFQKAFQMPFETMERELRDYIKQSRYNILRGKFEGKFDDSVIAATTLTEAEAQAYLGDLLLHSNRKDAYTYLEKALKLDPNLAMAHASLGMAQFREGNTKEARESLERAVTANSQNYLAHYYYAYTLSRTGPDDAPTGVGYSSDVAAKMREHLQKAIALRPDFPEPYGLLAFVNLVTSTDIDETIVKLKRVLSMSPGQDDIRYMLGQLYLHKNELKTARELLEQVAKSNADEQTRRHAETLVAHIHTVEEQKAQAEARAASGPPAIVTVDMQTTKEEEQPQDPSRYLREVLRKPAAGETQLQGTLVKIDCDAKGIVFVVQTPAGLLRLKTASFETIDLTTYDPKVQGEISCGARTSVVVVCYIPNADKRLKIDGTLKSIEFVPADFKLKP
jgi:tetratricopeptide (TPR) repeat protein